MSLRLLAYHRLIRRLTPDGRQRPLNLDRGLLPLSRDRRVEQGRHFGHDTLDSAIDQIVPAQVGIAERVVQ